MAPALWLLPVVGALIGWLTNALAVYMLFRPKRPVRLARGLFLQGVLPRRHADLAASIGRTVSRELLPVAELVDQLDVAAMKNDLLTVVADSVQRRFDAGFSRWLPHNLRTLAAAYVRDFIVRETDDIFDALMADFRRRAHRKLDVERFVTEKVLQLDLDDLERLAHRIAGKELQAIIIFGAVLGFIIGLLQMFVVGVLLPSSPAG